MQQPSVSKEKNEVNRIDEEGDSHVIGVCCGCVEVLESPYCRCTPTCRFKAKSEEMERFKFSVKESRETKTAHELNEFENQNEFIRREIRIKRTPEESTSEKDDDDSDDSDDEEEEEEEEEEETQSESSTSMGNRIQRQSSGYYYNGHKRYLYENEYKHSDNIWKYRYQNTSLPPVRSNVIIKNRNVKKVRDVGTQTRFPPNMTILNPRILSNPSVERKRQEVLNTYERYVYDKRNGAMYKIILRKDRDTPESDSSTDSYSSTREQYIKERNTKHYFTAQRLSTRSVGDQIRSQYDVNYKETRHKRVVRDVAIQAGVSYIKRKIFYEQLYTSPMIEKVWRNDVPFKYQYNKQNVVSKYQFDLLNRKRQGIPQSKENKPPRDPPTTPSIESSDQEVEVVVNKHVEHVVGYRTSKIETGDPKDSELDTSVEVIPCEPGILIEKHIIPDEIVPIFELEPLIPLIPIHSEIEIDPEPLKLEPSIDRPMTPKVKKRPKLKKPPDPDVFVRVGGGWMKQDYHELQHSPASENMVSTWSGLPFLKSRFINHKNKRLVTTSTTSKRNFRYASFI